MEQTTQGGVLSVVGRWDFHVTDLAAVLDAGRSAYRMNNPDHPDEADTAVTAAELAAEQLLEAFGVDAVFDTDGLTPVRVFTAALTHDEDDDESFDEDPFAIAYEDVD
jgi:hypothetical protein